jgi:membrane-associated protease RseP (regulator of RpoE activity)
MVPQAGAQQGARLALVGGTATGNITAPIPIPANATRPHGVRGPCTNCHTIGRPGASSLARVAGGAAPNSPRTTWQGVAAPAITADAVKPTLIEEIGMEICPAQGAGVKVTGIMGNSFASRAGLRAGDFIIAFNGAKVGNVRQFEQLIAQAPPEMDAQLKILRNGRTRDTAVMVDEGEMDGFTPIQRP